MEILSETEKAVVDMEFDLTEKEYETLLNHANDNMPDKELERLMIEWALVDMLKNTVEEKTE